MTDVALSHDLAAENTRLRREIAILRGEVVESEAKLRTADQHARVLDAENQRLWQENNDLSIGLGISDGPRRQLNDLLDVEPALSAALTRREA